MKVSLRSVDVLDASGIFKEQRWSQDEKRIARFEKVSFGQFSDGWDDTFQAIEKGENKRSNKETLKRNYDRIKLPRRATAGSAGYDFLLRLTLY